MFDFLKKLGKKEKPPPKLWISASREGNINKIIAGRRFLFLWSYFG
jgi:hypothetical protein